MPIIDKVVVILFLTVFCNSLCKCDKNDTCRNFRRRHILKLNCTNGGKIFLPELVGFYGKDCTDCQGQSPDLLAQKYGCTWRNRCKVKLQKTSMVTGCYHKINSVQVVKGPCIQNGTEIIDLITEKTLSGSGIKELPSTTFIVRSHRHFPWNYRYLTGSPSHTLRFNIKSGYIGQKMVLSVSYLDIHSTSDSLYIMHNEKRINITKEGNLEISIRDISYFEIHFQSKFYYQSTAKTRGFVICLKKMNKTDQNLGSLCDDVTSYDKMQFSLIKSASRKCPRRGRKGHRKCNKRKSRKRLVI